MFHNLRLPTVDSKSSYTENAPTNEWTAGRIAMFALFIGGSILLLVGVFFLVSDSNFNILGRKLKINANLWLDKASIQWLTNARCRCGNFKGRDVLLPTILMASLVTLITVVGVAFILTGGQQGKAGDGCMHIDVADNASHPFYQRDYFAGYFQELNYTVGLFGKHLNNANPSNFLPKGVDEMLINGGGSYLDPTFTVGNRNALLEPPLGVTFDNCTATTGMPCYSTSIIGNASLAWIERHIATDDNEKKPFFAFISLKSPHYEDGEGFPKAIPAPWYSHTTISESKAPRAPNYNCSVEDRHWLARSQAPMSIKEEEETDQLYVSRLKSLMSVDDLVHDLIQVLEDHNLLSDTYVIFTSDNGYHLGQFRMPEGKWQAYEDDIRLPMMIRGPGIELNVSSTLMATHVDLMPTLLGLAGQAQIPATMDGRNLANCLTRKGGDGCESSASSVLVEYLSLGNTFRYNHTVDTYNHSFVALRLLQSHTNESSLMDHWLYSFGSSVPSVPMRDVKYVEYRDSRIDWTAAQSPLEQELFDLERDPYELYNLIRHVSPGEYLPKSNDTIELPCYVSFTFNLFSVGTSVATQAQATYGLSRRFLSPRALQWYRLRGHSNS
jgi:N-acetylglucosamine-6-sulfatase